MTSRQRLRGVMLCVAGLVLVSQSASPASRFLGTVFCIDGPNFAPPSVPVSDVDSDGISDAWEEDNFLSCASAADATLDMDGDGLSNLAEFLAGTDPWDVDTNSDGIADGGWWGMDATAGGTDDEDNLCGLTVFCPPSA